MDLIRSDVSTEEILAEMGDRLKSHRLQQNLSVEELATSAGVGRATVIRAEAGQNTSLETLIKLLRALGRLAALDAFLPEPILSPLQLAAMQGRPRRRARKRGQARSENHESAPAVSGEQVGGVPADG